MEFEPDWKSKLFSFLLGKKRVMTVLDASQLMFRQDFKSSPAFTKISDQILYSLFGANTSAILLSFIAGRTIFRQSPLFSISKVIIDACFVLSSYYIATVYLAESIRLDVQVNKANYLKQFDRQFVYHINYLAVKYQISQSQQFEGLFDSKQLKQWIQQSYLRQMQINDV